MHILFLFFKIAYFLTGNDSACKWWTEQDLSVIIKDTDLETERRKIMHSFEQYMPTKIVFGKEAELKAGTLQRNGRQRKFCLFMVVEVSFEVGCLDELKRF
mgnify:CR=1 FL=1